MTQDLIIDCDTGSDDAIALLVGALHPGLNLVGITTVEGNCPVSLTTENTLKVLQSADIQGVPVFQGMDRPIASRAIDRSAGWPQILDLPSPTSAAQSKHAVDFLIDSLLGRDQGITIAAIGPLTNIAMAFRRCPDIIPKIDRLVIMGGAIAVGNITAVAEANIYWDPEAADIVFRSGANVDLFPLDATHMATITHDDVELWATYPTAAAKTAVSILPERIRMYESNMPLDIRGAPIHDALAVAAIVRPELVRFESADVQIELRGELTRGATVIDLRGFTEHQGTTKNARVATWSDRKGFSDLLGHLFRDARTASHDN